MGWGGQFLDVPTPPALLPSGQAPLGTLYGLAANRPPACYRNCGYLYIATDTGAASLSIGSAWVNIAGGGGGFTNPMTTLGDLIYENSTPAAARLAGNTTTTNKFLTQAGTGSISAAPGWNTVARADVPIFGPSGASHAQGGVPDPGSAAGSVRYLREDATWQIPGLSPTINSINAGETLSANSLVYLDLQNQRAGGVVWYAADNTATNPVKLGPVMGFSQGNYGSGTPATVQMGGILVGLASLTPGQLLYASTLGGYTNSVPFPASGSQTAVCPIAIALSPTTLLITGVSSCTFLLYENLLAANGTAVVNHWYDPEPSCRQARAYEYQAGNPPVSNPLTYSGLILQSTASTVGIQYSDATNANTNYNTLFENLFAASQNLVLLVTLFA